jgi:predicted AAA+ superfamily ATPase
MNKIIERKADTVAVKRLIRQFPITAILGSRQCGKTFLAKRLGPDHYFDLENPRDIARLETPQLALENLRGLIAIDEIQRLPSLFPLLRYLSDKKSRQKYLILGSAAPNLIKHTSETLAGRIGYHRLEGFAIGDVGGPHAKKLWLRGGYPMSYLARSGAESAVWRENYIATFLERDIPQLGISIPSRALRRFWMMLSHYHGNILNHLELASSFGVSDMTIRRYLEILEGTFMVRLLGPWHNNIGKRLIKRPKVYMRDSGILHALLSITTEDELLSHNKLGASWEGFALECAARCIGKRDEELFFWGTHSGAEVDLFWQDKGKGWAIEFKYEDAPKVTKSMQVATKDLDLDHLWVVYPGSQRYHLAEKISALPITDIGTTWNYH